MGQICVGSYNLSATYIRTVLLTERPWYNAMFPFTDMNPKIAQKFSFESYFLGGTA